MLTRVALTCVRRRRLVLIAWLLLTVVGFGVGSSVFGRLVADTGDSAAESVRGFHVLDDASPYGARIVAVLDGLTPTDPALTELTADLRALPGVARVQAPDAATGPTAAAYVASDGQAVEVAVDLQKELSGADYDTAFAATGDRLRAAGTDGVDVALTGNQIVTDEVNAQVERDLRVAELVTLPIVVVVMVVIFGGFLAAGLPLLGAVVSISGALLGLLGLSYALDLDPNVVPVTTFLGLGLAIDYSLLMVTRFREERARGLDVDGAVVRTAQTAGRTILFSALTVATSLAGLFVFAEPIFRAIAAAGVTVVLIAMAAALTLVPALLATIGRRLRTPTTAVPDTGAFSRLARRVQRRPWPVAVGVAVVLVLLGTPILGVAFENGGSNLLPAAADSRRADETLASRFPGQATAPVLVVSDSAVGELQSWADRVLPALPVGTVARTSPVTDLGAGFSMLSVIPGGTSQGSTAKDLVAALRADPAPGTAYVTGEAAFLVDFAHSIASRAPYALALVALATLVLLFLMTGSVVIPIKALVMNVVSLGATFGALVWIFVDGHLEGLLGFTANGALETWVPVLVFAFAFGLSMDYEVFLIARIKEAYDAQPEGARDNDGAVALGLQRSGRIITSAALLVVIVFAGFATAKMLGLKELGVALALAVAVDATVVRCLLVPATMTLLGERNWWAPAPLRRVHRRFGLHEEPAARAPREFSEV